MYQQLEFPDNKYRLPNKEALINKIKNTFIKFFQQKKVDNGPSSLLIMDIINRQ